MGTYAYASPSELKAIGQIKQPTLLLNDPIFRFFPPKNVESHVIMWEQKDNFVGLQQLRGMDGEPNRVKNVGSKRYVVEPGIYGEFLEIDEQAITARRPVGANTGFMDISDMVVEKQEQLLGREIDLMRYILWTLVTTGTFSVALPGGGVAHTDTFGIQTYDASAWGTAASATPLGDFRAVQLLGRGTSNDFGARATAFMNRVQVNKLLANTNAADLYGKRLPGLASALSVRDLNVIMEGEGLPQIVVWDDGYLTDAGVNTPFIPEHKIVVFAARPAGQILGNYQVTRNANNPNQAAGSYDMVYESPKPPMNVQVHRGHNGGPTIEYPSAVVVMDATS